MNEPQLSSGQLLLFTERYNQQKLSFGAALILCLLFGSLGAHKFYLRQYFSGLLYFLFCWTFIPAIFSIFDLFLIKNNVTRQNNLLALELLTEIDPNASSQLITIYQQHEHKFWHYLSNILIIAVGTMIFAELYYAIINEITPGKIINQLPETWFQHLPLNKSISKPISNNKYYKLKYDGLTLGMSLSEAKKVGYEQCSKNKYYIICSNNKRSYPFFLNYPVNFAIAQFNYNEQLILIHIYPAELPTYNSLINQIAAQSNGNKLTTNYLSLAGSNEDIFLNLTESSIDIGDREILQNYNKWIIQERLLNSSNNNF